MDDHAKVEWIESLRLRCRARGLVPTPPRRAILRAVHRVIDIQDPRLAALPVPDTRRLGFAIADFRVQPRGTCRECREEEEDKR